MIWSEEEIDRAVAAAVAAAVAVASSMGVEHPYLVLPKWMDRNFPTLIPKLNAAGIKAVAPEIGPGW